MSIRLNIFGRLTSANNYAAVVRATHRLKLNLHTTPKKVYMQIVLILYKCLKIEK